ncbi:MAG TPA: GTP 3',8-cyclase MoaA [Candidatus Bathyarchaeia archaeon]|nr:MAG: cyclic pyranopterin phosphate synthase [Candidatus Bathyarchaeota archaeon RBG_16_48_13]HJX23632.1 GTP 3',8-cyclase MoaA [Candidatus Bathyarchaeia archaeon]
MLFDNCGRPTTNLRASLTQRCNLKCTYCHAEGQVPNSKPEEMTSAEVIRIVRVAISLGMTRIKLTGGEPLLRRDIIEIAKGISSVQCLRDLSMTTNGTRLSILAHELRKAGLMRVNVNLPSLDPEVYRGLTGGDLKKTLNGVKASVDAGLSPVKLNMLVLRGVNEPEIGPLTAFAKRTGAILQILELEQINVGDAYYGRYHRSLDDIEAELRKEAREVRTRGDMQSRHVYSLPGVEVEVVHPIENSEFCAHCTRLRLTSDGMLKPCLMTTANLVDILRPLRDGATDEQLKELFIKAVGNRKPFYEPQINSQD